MEKKEMRIVTPEGRVSYPNLFEPSPDLKGVPKYSVRLMWPKTTDLMDLRRILVGAIKAKFGEDKKDWPVVLRQNDLRQYISPDGKNGWPLIDGDMSDKPENAGMVYVNLKTDVKHRPQVVDGRRGNEPILDPDEIYGGCYGKASVSAFAYAKEQKGVSLGLNNFQKTKDGEAFGASRVAASDEFEPVAGSDLPPDEEF